MVHVLRLRKYKGQSVFKFKRMEMLSALTAVVMLIDGAVIYALGLGISEMAKNYFVIPCIVMAVLALFEAVFIIAGWRLKNKPKHKILFILETIFGTIIVAGILYWKLYQFWGF